MRILKSVAIPSMLASMVAGCSVQQAAPLVVVLPVAVELALAEATRDAREVGRFGAWVVAQAGYPGRRSCFVSADSWLDAPVADAHRRRRRIAARRAQRARPAQEGSRGARGGAAQRRAGA